MITSDAAAVTTMLHAADLRVRCSEHYSGHRPCDLTQEHARVLQFLALIAHGRKRHGHILFWCERNDVEQQVLRKGNCSHTVGAHLVLY